MALRGNLNAFETILKYNDIMSYCYFWFVGFIYFQYFHSKNMISNKYFMFLEKFSFKDPNFNCVMRNAIKIYNLIGLDMLFLRLLFNTCIELHNNVERRSQTSN